MNTSHNSSGRLAILTCRAFALASLVLGGLLASGRPPFALAEGPTVAIDAGPRGNEPTKPGPIDSCVSVATGDEFQVDIVVLNVKDLLAWSLYVQYDPAVIRIIDRDVKVFQAANTGSAVIDLSDKLPDDDGIYGLSAVDTSDPPRPDSGSGVLARLYLKAVANGQSPLKLADQDLNNDGKPDRGLLLRNADNQTIGDDNGDTFFDGPREDALVMVGNDCPPGTTHSAPAIISASNGSTPWMLVAGAALGAIAVVAGAVTGILLFRRASRRDLPSGP